jgi:DNA polymerase III subunit alpha
VIKYSLAALKNVGRGAVEHVVATREAGGPFASLGDFARRVDSRAVNKRALESLARAGAFDEINANRAQVAAGVEAILAMASRTSADSEQGQSSLFGSGGGTAAEDVPCRSPKRGR